MRIKNKIFVFPFKLVVLLATSLSFGQVNKLVAAQQAIEKEDFEQASQLVQKIDTRLFNPMQWADFLVVKGEIAGFNNNEIESFKFLTQAKKKYLQLNAKTKAIDLNSELFYLLYSQDNNPTDPMLFLNEYMQFARSNKDTLRLARGYQLQACWYVNDPDKKDYCLKLFHQALRFNRIAKDEKLQSTIYNNLSVFFNENLKRPDSALIYLKRDQVYLEKNSKNDELCFNFINQADSYTKKKAYKQAIQCLLKADQIPLKKYPIKTKAILFFCLSENYACCKQYKEAYTYHCLFTKKDSILNQKAQNISINDIQTKYRTKEKELENLQLKVKNKNKSVWIYSILSAVLIGGVLLYFQFVNLKRARLLALNGKELETQKLETTLKKQEVLVIESLVEGQERERRIMAQELHDNMGSQLAALNLNIGVLKHQLEPLNAPNKAAIDKIELMMVDLYNDVRALAHEKKQGVIVQEGLVPALNKTIQQLSNAQLLTVSLYTFGLYKRIDNSLEIMLFRMLQESLTNIVKHAQATQANLYLTQHPDHLNIMLEDNGIGFTYKSNSKQGMGLLGIEEKVEQLGGQFRVDSTPNNGTTLIFDIPL
ncbi:MAG: hypothetical protein CFE24_12380 [Flavobacterium sp. BFFFF2]|nr:MAG: hypothetical protein CFE24_12380 [Flavobacterium sp. BFFFF2]